MDTDALAIEQKLVALAVLKANFDHGGHGAVCRDMNAIPSLLDAVAGAHAAVA
jgi:hypothetical protein